MLPKVHGDHLLQQPQEEDWAVPVPQSLPVLHLHIHNGVTVRVHTAPRPFNWCLKTFNIYVQGYIRATAELVEKYKKYHIYSVQ